MSERKNLMTYDARQVANWFVNRAGRDGKTLSLMSLLKLTYISHGWHLETRNMPLFSNRIEAWQYGPVVPEVYRDFRKQGINVSAPVNSVPDASFTEQDEDFLEQIYKIYGSLAAFQLSDITHVPGGPWHIATKTGGYYAPITDDLIKKHYVLKRAEAKKHIANA